MPELRKWSRLQRLNSEHWGSNVDCLHDLTLPAIANAFTGPPIPELGRSGGRTDTLLQQLPSDSPGRHADAARSR